MVGILFEGHTVSRFKNQSWAAILHRVYLELSAASAALAHQRWRKQLAPARWQHVCVRRRPDAARGVGRGGGLGEEMKARFPQEWIDPESGEKAVCSG